jgi:hypothetical protein
LSKGKEEHIADLKIAQLVKREGKVMEQMLAGQMALMGLNDRGVLLRKMRLNIRYRYGAVDAMRFNTTRYGMIKLHGITRTKPVERRSSRSYFLKQKAAQDWYTPVANRMVPKIADKVSEIRGDQAVKESVVLEKLRKKT